MQFGRESARLYKGRGDELYFAVEDEGIEDHALEGVL